MTTNRFLLWSSRVLGIGVSVFLGLFALDAFQAGKPVWRALEDFAVHLTPAAVLLAIVVLSWRRAWLGGAAFVLLGTAYAFAVGFRPDRVVAISGPLLTVGALFFWSWRANRPQRAS